MIREFIENQLLQPFKNYPTTIQDTLLTLITERLVELYEYTKEFPEIVSPNKSRLDILQAITAQFNFRIREEAPLEEQLSILENILHVYKSRGSIETIENLWKYYGGELPKDLKINIPSYNLFRYSMSALSGKHVFPDRDHYRTGVYEIIVSNSDYPIADLRKFLLEELVAAGNRIYFTKSIYSILVEDSAYHYQISTESHRKIDMKTASYRSVNSKWSNGLYLSSKDSLYSGSPDLFLEITSLYQLDVCDLTNMNPRDLVHTYLLESGIIRYISRGISKKNARYILLDTSYTGDSEETLLELDYYNANGDSITNLYAGYFILRTSLLGSEVL